MIFRTLLGLVVLAPLPFASVYPWSWSLIACVVGLLLVAWTLGHLISGERPEIGLSRTWPFLLLFLSVSGWAAIQSSTLALEGWHHPLWNSAATALDTGLAGRVSLNPEATQSALLRLLSYGGIFWLALQYGREPEKARVAVYALAVAGFLYATYGLAVQLTDARKILWYEKFAYLNDLTSTFVNRNSYATYAGLTLVCISGLLIKLAVDDIAGHHGRRERLRVLLEAGAARGWLLLLAWTTVLTALLLTHSRAGFLSTVVGLLVLIVAVGLTGAIKARYAVLATLLFLAAGGGFFALSGDLTAKRLMTTSTEWVLRARVNELSIEAIETTPLLGTGYGTFEDVFRFYRSEMIAKPVAMAHNTYIENALELGIPGALALSGAVAGLFLLTVRGVRRRRRDSIYPCIGLAATVLVAAHSTVDFSLQIPAVAITYSFLMGICCAQCWSSREPPDPW